MGNQIFGNTAKENAHSAISDELALMLEFVTLTFGATAEHLPNPDHLLWRAKAWLRTLTPDFFQPEMHYVYQVCCRLRGDRKDAIKADEILRIAERVYGCPVAAWGNPEFARYPEVWSTTDNDWIPLSQAVERLFRAETERKMLIEETYENLKNPQQAISKRLEELRPQLLEMIYGGNE